MTCHSADLCSLPFIDIIDRAGDLVLPIKIDCGVVLCIVVITVGKDIVITDVPTPYIPGNDQAVVQDDLTGICVSEIGIYNGIDFLYMNMPVQVLIAVQKRTDLTVFLTALNDPKNIDILLYT